MSWKVKAAAIAFYLILNGAILLAALAVAKRF